MGELAQRSIVLGVIVLGAIVQGEIVWGAIGMGVNCPGGFSRGLLVGR